MGLGFAESIPVSHFNASARSQLLFNLDVHFDVPYSTVIPECGEPLDHAPVGPEAVFVLEDVLLRGLNGEGTALPGHLIASS